MMRSMSSAEEKQDIELHIEKEHQLKSKTSFYVPKQQEQQNHQNPKKTNSLQVAKGAILTIYDIHQKYERRRQIENISFLLAMTGIVCILIDIEYLSQQKWKNTVRLLNFGLTLVLLLCILYRYQIEREIRIKRNLLPQGVSLWRTKKFCLEFCIEIFICSLIIPPFYGIVYNEAPSFEVWEWKYYDHEGDCRPPLVDSIDATSCYLVYSYKYEIIGLCALLRLYMVPRMVCNVSNFASYRTSYLGTLYTVDTMGSLFAIKCLLVSNPIFVLLSTFLTTVVLTAYTLAIFEAPINGSLAPLSNALWLVVLTMSSIGYGDLYPITFCGQLVLVFGGMFAGILLIGILSAALFTFLELSERDRRFLHLLKCQRHDKALKEAAAKLIQVSWIRYQASTGQLAKSTSMYEKLYQQMYHCAAKQRALRKTHLSDFTSPTRAISQMERELSLQMKKNHLTHCQQLLDIEKRLDAMLGAAKAKVASSSSSTN